MATFYSTLICVKILINIFLSTINVNAGSAIVRHHRDGSISSNSGAVSLAEKFLFTHRQFRSTRLEGDFKTRLLTPIQLAQHDVEKIVAEHNKYRRMVSAKDMQKISWDPMLAMKAQKHADECTLEHTVNRGNIGENIWIAQYDDFSLAVRLWYEEVYDKQCSCKNAFKECCGHYTQLIWAETNKIGCGFAKCKSVVNAPGHHYSLVCQYSPAGNLVYMDNGQYVGLPAYKESSSKEPTCSECPSGSICDNGLCDSSKV